MKKRILALALAGTTAFSVFGATMSVNAAAPTGWPVDSAHVLSSNDIYKEYNPVAIGIDATYTGSTQTLNYVKVEGAYVHKEATGTADSYVIASTQGEASGASGVNSTDVISCTSGNIWVDLKNKVVYVNNVVQVDLDKYFATNTIEIVGLGSFTIDKTTATNGFAAFESATFVKLNSCYAGIKQGAVTDYKYTFLTKGDVKPSTPFNELTELTGNYYTKDGKLYCVGSVPVADKELLDKAKQAVTVIAESDLYTVNNAKLDVEVTSKLDNFPYANWTFNGSTSADTTIYPWTVETEYTYDVNGDIQVAVNEAVSTPTVYLFDFLPFNGTNINSSKVATAYNNVVAARNAYAAIDAVKYPAAAAEAAEDVKEAEAAFAKLVGNVDWVAETGDGSSYGIRAEVVDEYEDFLSELVLLRRYGDYTVSWTDFKDEYNDQFVSGYYYNPYTGLATKWEWTTDLYNLSELLDDIYQSSVNNAYLNMNTSELMYLMQQYDKYVGYIDKAEVSNDEWGDLLVSILENVAEDDFKKAADYKTFSRKAEDAIDAYNYAETSSMIKTAERRMYDLIISAQTKSTGAADAQDELGATVDSLFFNAKSAPAEYLTDGIDDGNAELTNYAYIAAVTVNKKVTISDIITLEKSALTTTGYYSLYPAKDYKESDNTAAQFPGNDLYGTKNSASYGVDVTDEYEWFLNVYELANAVNGITDSKAVNGIVEAVNDALVSAVDNLAVTVSAPASATTALDEMVEDYEETLDFYVTGNGVNEEDFNETYYAAYTKALEIAEAAEGATQVAHARRMVAVAGEALTYQGAQITVTKTMITDLNEAITSGKTALDAIKNSDDYNAAQVTALNKAIAQAQDVVDIYNGKYSSSYNKVNHASVASVGDKDGIVASDITGAIDAIDAAINYSEIVMGWSQNDAGKWQYGTEEGYLSNGWNKIGKTWFYFNADGTAKQSEWFQENGTWYWFNSNCGAATGWAKVDGEWYFFKGNNAMKTGWEKVDGNWYYMASSGKMVTGWCEVNGKWYYFSKESNSLGQMLYSTTVDGYKLGADGAWIK